MCFYLTTQSPQIASKDIECWKILRITGCSEIMFYEYIPSKRNPIVYLVKYPCVSKGFIIHHGYHSFISELEAKLNIELRVQVTSFCIKKFIIPKGTTYYINRQKKEYVSETIIMCE